MLFSSVFSKTEQGHFSVEQWGVFVDENLDSSELLQKIQNSPSPFLQAKVAG